MSCSGDPILDPDTGADICNSDNSRILSDAESECHDRFLNHAVSELSQSASDYIKSFKVACGSQLEP